MTRRFEPDFFGGELPGFPSRRTGRRRKFTPPELARRRPRLMRRRRKSRHWSAVQLSQVAARLTPRQAVVWLMNLDAMIQLYETVSGRGLSYQSRQELERSIRSIVSDHRSVR